MDDQADSNDEVYSITSARQPHTEEISHRERNYAISMAIRTVCFVGGVIAWFHIMWLGVVLFIGALVLPYTSVILANAGVRKAGPGTNLTDMGSNELDSADDTLTQNPRGSAGPDSSDSEPGSTEGSDTSEQ